MSTTSFFRARFLAPLLAVAALASASGADVTLTASITGGVTSVYPGQSFSVDLTWSGEASIAASDSTVSLSTNQLLFTGAAYDAALNTYAFTSPAPAAPAVAVSEVFCSWYKTEGFLGKSLVLTFQVPENYTGPSTVTVTVGAGDLEDTSGQALTGITVNTSINIVPVPAFVTWASQYPGLTTAAQREMGADPDGDGRNNLLEFAIKGDPSASGSSGLSAYVTGANGVPSLPLTLVTAVRRGATFAAGANNVQTATKDGVVYVIEGGSDLANLNGTVTALGASDAAPAGTSLPSLSSTAWEYQSFKLDQPGITQGFLRLRVSSAP